MIGCGVLACCAVVYQVAIAAYDKLLVFVELEEGSMAF
jgi:hypothetical protein